MKRFQGLLKESRLTAFRQAGGAHATVRSVLKTKLFNFHAAVADCPSLLCSSLPQLMGTRCSSS